jgi:hypothetical protein
MRTPQHSHEPDGSEHAMRLRRLNHWQAENPSEDMADLFVESSVAAPGEELPAPPRSPTTSPGSSPPSPPVPPTTSRSSP